MEEFKVIKRIFWIFIFRNLPINKTFSSFWKLLNLIKIQNNFPYLYVLS